MWRVRWRNGLSYSTPVGLCKNVMKLCGECGEVMVRGVVFACGVGVVRWSTVTPQ